MRGTIALRRNESLPFGMHRSLSVSGGEDPGSRLLLPSTGPELRGIIRSIRADESHPSTVTAPSQAVNNACDVLFFCLCRPADSLPGGNESEGRTGYERRAAVTVRESKHLCQAYSIGGNNSSLSSHAVTVSQGFEVIGPDDLGPFAARSGVRPLTVVSAIGPGIIVLVAGVGLLLH